MDRRHDRERNCSCYDFCDIFRFGDRILVTDSVTDQGVFIGLRGNQLIWVRHDTGTNEVRIVYSPFDEVTVQRLS